MTIVNTRKGRNKNLVDSRRYHAKRLIQHQFSNICLKDKTHN